MTRIPLGLDASADTDLQTRPGIALSLRNRPSLRTVTVEYHQLLDDDGSWTPGPNVLAPQLAAPGTTDIVVHVAEGPNTLAPIDVRR